VFQHANVWTVCRKFFGAKSAVSSHPVEQVLVQISTRKRPPLHDRIARVTTVCGKDKRRESGFRERGCLASDKLSVTSKAFELKQGIAVCGKVLDAFLVRPACRPGFASVIRQFAPDTGADVLARRGRDTTSVFDTVSAIAGPLRARAASGEGTAAEQC